MKILMYLRKNNNNKIEVSIDEPLNVDWDGNELLLSDILGTDEDITQKNIEEQTDRELLHLAMNKLSGRERNIVELRFGINNDGDEMTQKEVADLLGISQSYISRLEKRIIKRLRTRHKQNDKRLISADLISYKQIVEPLKNQPDSKPHGSIIKTYKP